MAVSWFSYTFGFMNDIIVTYHGTDGQMALDKIRLLSTLASSALLKVSVPNVTSDNYSVW